jgi:NAD(P)-dependent dehydrogenase (short-subunit alcohol dehydrogenase family)
MAEGFIDRGHTVLGCARSTAAVDELTGKYGRPHAFEVVDVADATAVARWATDVLADGPPDLLVNNAALINRNASLWKVPADEFSQLMDINIKGVHHVIRAFVPAMVERRSGVVVNISSAWGRSVSADVAPYCATKWAIEGLTKALAEELPDKMAAAALNPGVIDTDMLRSCFGSDASAYDKPSRWARNAVPYLLSLGRKDNGQSLTVPAG